MRPILLCLLLGISMPSIAAPAASLCERTEQVLFNCSVASSSKVISLCASPNLTKQQGYLQYRFGRQGKIEMVFPAERKLSQSKFRYAHYFRAQVDRTELRFSTADYDYIIFSDYEGEEKPAAYEAGLTVESKNHPSKSASFACKKPVRAKFDVIKNAVSCDAENALNLDGCK